MKAESVKVQGVTLTGLTDQAEIFLPGNPSRFKVVVNDRDAQHLLGGNFFIRGNYHRSENARFNVRAVTSLLAGKSETHRKKHFFQGMPVNRCNFWHGQTFAIVECLSNPIQAGETQAPFWYS